MSKIKNGKRKWFMFYKTDIMSKIPNISIRFSKWTILQSTYIKLLKQQQSLLEFEQLCN